MIRLWIPSEDGADLVELLQPRGEGPTAGSIGLGFLGDGVDCDPDMLRAQMAAHDAGDIGRLPSTGPHFPDLAAEVRARERGDQPRGDAVDAAGSVVPPRCERSDVVTSLGTHGCKLGESGIEMVFDPARQIRNSSNTGVRTLGVRATLFGWLFSRPQRRRLRRPISLLSRPATHIYHAGATLPEMPLEQGTMPRFG